MEIEFNTSRLSKPAYAEPAARQDVAPANPQAEATSSAANLEDKLNQLPVVRPEKVDQAKALVLQEGYPPNDVLDRIAVLLGVHFKP